MFSSYLKIALRNFGKYRLTSFINLLGLTVGIVVCLLIVLFIKTESNFDNFHEKADRIALFRQLDHSARSGSKFAPFLGKELAQIDKITRLVPDKPLLDTEETANYEPNFYFADTAFLSIFDFSLAVGDPQTVLKEPYSVVLSQKMATKYFPNLNPIGQTITYQKKQPLTVTGILENTPDNSHLQIDFLCSAENLEQLSQGSYNSYWDSRTLTYVLLSEQTDIAALSAQLPEIAQRTEDANANIWQLSLIPLRDIYLRYNLSGGIVSNKAIENIYIFSVIAFFVLLLACFNYISLVTARSNTRAREVGVRRLLGANRKQLIAQFLSESTFMLAFALLLALGIIQLAFPLFNSFVGKELSFVQLVEPKTLGLSVGIFVAVACITGLYPALALSSFQLVNVLKKTLFGKAKDSFFRKGLVVAQFTISITMIIATVVVLNQMYFIKNKDLGYEREAVINIDFQGNLSSEKKIVFQQAVNQLAAVATSTFCSVLPGNGAAYNKLVEQYVPEGKSVTYTYIQADANFLSTFDIRLKEGRNFSSQVPSSGRQFLANQALVDHLEWKSDAVGQEIGYYSYQNSENGGYREVPVRGEIIGIIDDYHQSNLRTSIEPMLVLYGSGWQGQLAVKAKTASLRSVVEDLESTWKQNFPNEPFAFQFLDDAFQQTYQQEEKVGQIFSVFSGLAIFISCLGLLGLVTFAAERRTKEIGVRKVLGASVLSIIRLLSLDFVKLIFIALFLAIPIAVYFMQEWLNRFVYRVDLEWWIFAGAGLIALVITFSTIGYQSARAALANPVKSLRSE
ncbi:MAG: ABC transporter permease [Bacteroidota bacterium]